MVHMFVIQMATAPTPLEATTAPVNTVTMVTDTTVLVSSGPPEDGDTVILDCFWGDMVRFAEKFR